VHDRVLLAAHPQFLPNFATHPEYGAAAVAPVQKMRTDPFSFPGSVYDSQSNARGARTSD